jgi:hypothetical protein
VLDTIWGGLNGLGALSAVGTSQNEWNADYSRGSVIVTGLLWLGVSGASAIYGYSKVGECKDAQQQLMMRSTRYPTAPQQGWAPPQGGPPPPAYPPPGYPPPQPGTPPPYPPPAPPPPAPPQPVPQP